MMAVDLAPLEELHIPLVKDWVESPDVLHHAFGTEKALGRERLSGFLGVLRHTWKFARIIHAPIPIGLVYLNSYDPGVRKADMGIFIGDPRKLGQGIGKQAILAYLEEAFEAWGLRRMQIRVNSYNLRGLRCYRRVGFIEEGRLREDGLFGGEIYDTIIMSLLAAEWLAVKVAHKAQVQAQTTLEGRQVA